MEALSFVFSDKATVPGHLGTDVQAEVIGHILEVKPDKILLICDSGADAHHPNYFAPLSPDVAETGSGSNGEQAPDIQKYMLPEGDAAKSWEHLTALMRWSFDIGTTKRSLIVAFGGGALLNIAGLFASILFRGTKVIYVPTTFLAMHDVVTSLKTSICYDGRKNNIGSFYAPLKILIDLGFCRTLPRKELFSGLGELAKNALLLGGKHAQGFVAAMSNENIDGAHGGSGEEFVLDDKTLHELTALGIDAKMQKLLVDPYERTTGMIFEYGHTVSHAIEKAYGDGVIPHGIGVTYGMLSSSYAAELMDIMSPEDRKEHDALCWLLLKRWPLPEPRPTIEKIMSFAMRDSKRGLTGEGDDDISDVLLHKMGDVVPTKTNNLSKFPSKYVSEWLRSMGFPCEDSTKCGSMCDDVLPARASELKYHDFAGNVHKKRVSPWPCPDSSIRRRVDASC
jgi:3-dehydroquinate synthase/2-deoxy-scyllo-inosose synthase